MALERILTPDEIRRLEEFLESRLGRDVARDELEVLGWGVACRLMGGQPTYRTRFGTRLEDSVIETCYGVRGIGGLVQVSEEWYDTLDRIRNDWATLNEMYRDEISLIKEWFEKNKPDVRRTIV
ncbi:MAG: hypothetical protein DRO39_05010 [Thermoprotei archaeon]|nr:MAG: hypothetical protein DRO39_05010 [Thermoprotei archaeon]